MHSRYQKTRNWRVREPTYEALYSQARSASSLSLSLSLHVSAELLGWCSRGAILVLPSARARAGGCCAASEPLPLLSCRQLYIYALCARVPAIDFPASRVPGDGRERELHLFFCRTPGFFLFFIAFLPPTSS